MFNRTIRMLASGVKPVFVFDGKPPTLKGGEVCGWVRCMMHGVVLVWFVSSGHIGPTTHPPMHPSSIDTYKKKHTAGEAPAEAGGGRGGAEAGQGGGCVLHLYLYMCVCVRMYGTLPSSVLTSVRTLRTKPNQRTWRSRSGT